MIRVAVVTIAIVFAVSTRIDAGEATEKRVRFLVESLKRPVSEIEKGDLPLPFLLESLSALASPEGADKDHTRKVTILMIVLILLSDLTLSPRNLCGLIKRSIKP